MKHIKWIMLLERGGKKVKTYKENKFYMVTLSKVGHDQSIQVGISNESLLDAILNCAKRYARSIPECELTKELTKYQQRLNMKAAKKILEESGLK